MKTFCADLHVHVGRAGGGRAVKITAAASLTVENIASECLNRKGIQIAGIVDCSSPAVLDDIALLLREGKLVEIPAGGLRYGEGLVIIPGAEVEVEVLGSPAHFVAYFPTVEAVTVFSRSYMAEWVKNPYLSSQKIRADAVQLLKAVTALEGILVPAHAFTPHRSIYGTCTDRISKVFGELASKLAAVELGLSADTRMADRIGELSSFAFLSNSDAHSLPKIGREYNSLLLAEQSWRELLLALMGKEGRSIAANHGLDPRLGKYHRTRCSICGHIAAAPPPVLSCERCGSTDVTVGVADRLEIIADRPEPQSPPFRPEYRYQIPLEFIPGLGKASIDKLIAAHGSEIEVLQRVSTGELERTVGRERARLIVLARRGGLCLSAGGGGSYGKVLSGR